MRIPVTFYYFQAYRPTRDYPGILFQPQREMLDVEVREVTESEFPVVASFNPPCASDRLLYRGYNKRLYEETAARTLFYPSEPEYCFTAIDGVDFYYSDERDALADHPLTARSVIIPDESVPEEYRYLVRYSYSAMKGRIENYFRHGVWFQGKFWTSNLIEPYINVRASYSQFGYEIDPVIEGGVVGEPEDEDPFDDCDEDAEYITYTVDVCYFRLDTPNMAETIRRFCADRFSYNNKRFASELERMEQELSLSPDFSSYLTKSFEDLNQYNHLDTLPAELDDLHPATDED